MANGRHIRPSHEHRFEGLPGMMEALRASASSAMAQAPISAVIRWSQKAHLHMQQRRCLLCFCTCSSGAPSPQSALPKLSHHSEIIASARLCQTSAKEVTHRWESEDESVVASG